MMNTPINNDRGDGASTRAKLVSDLKAAVADAGDLMQDVVSSSTDELAAVHRTLEARMGDARAMLGDAGGALETQARHAAACTQGYARRNPWKVLGLAAVAGLIAGAALGRR